MKSIPFTECVDLVGSRCKPFKGTKKYVNTGAVDVDQINEAGIEIIDYEKRPSRANLEASLGDVLFAKMQGTKKTLLINSSLVENIYSTGFCAVKAKKNVLTERCLYHLLTSKMFLEQKDKNCSGATQKAITNKGLQKVILHVPDINKQNLIAAQLDLIVKIITLRKQELVELDDLIKARFVEMFGNGHDGFCNTKKLGEFCKFQQGTQIPVEEQIEEQLEGYTRFLRIIDYTQAPQIPRYVSVKGREIAEDSVVIVRYGATAGFVGHGYAGILANNLFEVVPDESILSKDFLYLALKYGTFEQEVHDKAFGAAMPALSFGMMNDIGVVTPNSTAQNGFVDFVKQVHKSKLLSGCRLFHSWAPENRDKPKHVGVPQRRTKVLRGGRRQQ